MLNKKSNAVRLDDRFELPVNFHGEELLFPAQLHQYGYTQKIEINIHGIPVAYERDEERNWRAIVDPAALTKNRSLNIELLQAVAHSIEEILK